MSNAVVSRLGQVEQAGSATALFLTKFAGEVLQVFDTKCVSLDKHTVRTISGAKEATFPVTGQGSAAYHTPGVELLGSAINHNETKITIDDQLIADRFIANIDEAMNYYDARRIYVHDCAEALQRAFDSNVLRCGVLGARASALVAGAGANGGTRISDTDSHTSGSSLAGSIFAAAQAFYEKNLDPNAAWCFVKPAQYILLAQTTGVLNRDWGGAGSYSMGSVGPIGGIKIVMTNQLPSTNVVTGPVKYQGDFSDTVALVMSKEAVGTLKLIDLATEMQYQPQRQGTLLLAKYAVGHKYLRPDCAVEISKASF